MLAASPTSKAKAPEKIVLVVLFIAVLLLHLAHARRQAGHKARCGEIAVPFCD
jgi:hypothetical protein